MASNDIAQLLPLFAHNLEYNEHRMLTKDKMVLSFWDDNALMICAMRRNP